MGKLDEVMRAASLGGRPGAFPPGTDPAQAVGRPARLEGVRGDRSASWIAVGRIVADPDQPRREFDPDDLERLAASLKTQGQLQPIRVRWDEGRGVYVIIAGERRWRASKMAGLAELQCTVQEGDLPADRRLALQLVENALREDLKPVEQARAYRRLMDATGWTMTELAAELSVHQTSVSRALTLLDLPCTVQDQVEQGGLSPSAAYELSKLPADVREEVADAVVGSGLTRAEVAKVVSAVRAKRPAPGRRPEPVVVDLGDATVTVKWKRGADGLTPEKALRLALKQLQARERDGEAA